MAPPDSFRVEYQINPWMNPDSQLDTVLAKQQWHELYGTYLKLGVTVQIMPVAPLADYVFAADGSLTIGNKTMLANFRYQERAPEVDYHRLFSSDRSFGSPASHFEGGDALVWNGKILLGFGFRSQQAAADELADFFHTEVIALELADPKFFHLDTAMTVLSDKYIAYYPPAFSATARQTLANLPVTLVEATANDADQFGMNSVVIGQTILMAPQATALAQRYKSLGFEITPLDTSEFQKSGGGIKCLSNILY